MNKLFKANKIHSYSSGDYRPGNHFGKVIAESEGDFVLFPIDINLQYNNKPFV